jgi:hypothetical protein
MVKHGPFPISPPLYSITPLITGGERSFLVDGNVQKNFPLNLTDGNGLGLIKRNDRATREAAQNRTEQNRTEQNSKTQHRTEQKRTEENSTD